MFDCYFYNHTQKDNHLAQLAIFRQKINKNGDKVMSDLYMSCKCRRSTEAFYFSRKVERIVHELEKKNNKK